MAQNWGLMCSKMSNHRLFSLPAMFFVKRLFKNDLKILSLYFLRFVEYFMYKLVCQKWLPNGCVEQFFFSILMMYSTWDMYITLWTFPEEDKDFQLLLRLPSTFCELLCHTHTPLWITLLDTVIWKLEIWLRIDRTLMIKCYHFLSLRSLKH